MEEPGPSELVKELYSVKFASVRGKESCLYRKTLLFVYAIVGENKATNIYEAVLVDIWETSNN